jgi:hypothetical protein
LPKTEREREGGEEGREEGEEGEGMKEIVEGGRVKKGERRTLQLLDALGKGGWKQGERPIIVCIQNTGSSFRELNR